MCVCVLKARTSHNRDVTVAILDALQTLFVILSFGACKAQVAVSFQSRLTPSLGAGGHTHAELNFGLLL